MTPVPPALAQSRKKGRSGFSRYTFSGIKKWLPMGKISEKTVIDFTRGLAVMLQARLPLIDALKTSENQATDHKFRDVLVRLRKNVESGKSLAEAMGSYPNVFDSFYQHLVKVGETAGILDHILLRLADHLAKKHGLKKKIKMALIYPAMVLSVATGAIFFLLMVIVPTFADMYRDFDAELPELTQAVLSVSQWVSGNVIWLILISIILIIGIRQALTRQNIKYWVDRLTLNIPLVGSLLVQSIVVQFCQTMGSLLQSGVTMMKGLSIVNNASGNLLYKDAIDQVLRTVRKGGSMMTGLRKSTLFPPIVLQMITVGEETAELDKMLLQVADHYREEIDLKVETLTFVLEPGLIIILGLILGFLIVAMYLPMFEMMNVIG